MRRSFRAAALGLAALGLVATPLRATTWPVAAGPATVFNPASLTIQVGDTVMWNIVGLHNVVQTTAPGNCTAMAGGFNSGTCGAVTTFSRTFNTPGVISYMCSCHCTFNNMRGTITVVPLTCGTCPGDLTGDSRVDGDDINAFVACYISGSPASTSCVCADMNDDDAFSSADVSALVTRLLTSATTGC